MSFSYESQYLDLKKMYQHFTYSGFLEEVKKKQENEFASELFKPENTVHEGIS